MRGPKDASNLHLVDGGAGKPAHGRQLASSIAPPKPIAILASTPPQQANSIGCAIALPRTTLARLPTLASQKGRLCPRSKSKMMQGCAVGPWPTTTTAAATFGMSLRPSSSVPLQMFLCKEAMWPEAKKRNGARRSQMLSKTVKVSSVTVWVLDSMVTDCSTTMSRAGTTPEVSLLKVYTV